MRCPPLVQVPPPSAGETGWPWTEESEHISDTFPNGQLWPKVSIVTPSYNQGRFIEETIRSVLLQGYPNLEYLIIDGGSTDGSIEIIRKYEPWLTYWGSEPDRGQTHAISKGFARANGDVCAWLNSDDVYTQGAILDMIDYIRSHPRTDVVYGDADFVDTAGQFSSRFMTRNFAAPQMFFDHFVPQPAAFIRRRALERVGGLDESLRFCMDYDLWLRIALRGRIEYVPRVWARFRVHPASKGSTLQALRWSETAAILSRFLGQDAVPESWRQNRSEAVGRAHWHASVEYHRARDDVRAREHIEQATRFAPSFLASRAFAGVLLGGLAARMTEKVVTEVSGFMALIPDSVPDKKKGSQRVWAYGQALLAINDATPRDLARRYARSALKQDAYWFSNRHVVSRAFR
jgi:hypothetical protein